MTAMDNHTAQRLTGKIQTLWDNLDADEGQLFEYLLRNTDEISSSGEVNGYALGRENSIECVAAAKGFFDIFTEIVSPRDPASGQAKGFTYQKITWDN